MVLVTTSRWAAVASQPYMRHQNVVRNMLLSPSVAFFSLQYRVSRAQGKKAPQKRNIATVRSHR